jgi:hypothetical protein
MSVRAAFPVWPGACRCERSLSARSLLKEKHTMAATVAETIPHTLNTVMSNWRLLP